MRPGPCNSSSLRPGCGFSLALLGIPGREAFSWPPGEPRHHLYLMVDGTPELHRHLAFRDALRAAAELRDAYSALKRSLAARHARDRVAYREGKSEFVRAVLEVRLGAGA